MAPAKGSSWYRIFSLLIIALNVYAAHAAFCNPPKFNNSNPLPATSATISSDFGDNGTVEAEWLPNNYKFRRQRFLRKRVDPASEGEWTRAVTAGRSLWTQLQQVLERPPRDDKPVCDIDQYWLVVTDDDAIDPMSTGDFDDMAPPELLTKNDPTAWSSAAIYYPKQGKQPFDYQFEVEYSPSLKTINAHMSYGTLDKLDGTVTRAPNRWSDVVWAYWLSLCKEQKADPSELRWIFRQFITNEFTKAIIDKIFAGPEYTSLAADAPYTTTVKPTDDAFFALLKTPNVVGPVYMLLDHPNGLRRKTIKDIIVKSEPTTRAFGKLFDTRHYYLIIEFDDFVQQSPIEGTSSESASTIAGAGSVSS